MWVYRQKNHRIYWVRVRVHELCRLYMAIVYSCQQLARISEFCDIRKNSDLKTYQNANEHDMQTQLTGQFFLQEPVSQHTQTHHGAASNNCQ